MAVHLQDGKALIVLGMDSAPLMEGAPMTASRTPWMGQRNPPTLPSGSIFYFLQRLTEDGFELRAQCVTTAHCGRGGVKLAAGVRERRNNWPLEQNFQAHGRTHDLQVIGK